MSNFTRWLVEKEYTTSEDKDTIEAEISATEAYILYQMFLDEGGDDDNEDN